MLAQASASEAKVVELQVFILIRLKLRPKLPWLGCGAAYGRLQPTRESIGSLSLRWLKPRQQFISFFLFFVFVFCFFSVATSIKVFFKIPINRTIKINQEK